MYVNVIIDNKTNKLDRFFTYRVKNDMTKEIATGKRVLVPFGYNNGIKVAFVVEILNKTDVNERKIKDIYEILDEESIVSDEMIRLSFWMRDRYVCSYNDSIKTVLPPGDIKDIETLYKVSEEHAAQYGKDFFTKEELLSSMKLNELKKLIKDGIISTKFKVKNRLKKSSEKYITLCKEVSEDEKLSAKQRKVVDYLIKNEESKLKELLIELNISSSPVNSLEKKKIIKIYEKDYHEEISYKVEDYPQIELNNEQAAALKSIKDSISYKKSSKFLLKGVTGSGKTEVYLRAVSECIKNGKDAIVLVPEISLTPQTINRFKGRFKENVFVLHSKLKSTERFEEWNAIRNNDFPSIIVGARSAIFAPCKNLGLIIIDEEHDSSYISSQNPKYHTDEIAYMRSMLDNATLVLASATPSINTYYLQKKGVYNLLELRNRIGLLKEPDIEIVDMKEELRAKNFSPISKKLYEAMRDSLERNEQVILFLNKRGYGSFTMCNNCGYTFICPSCDISLTYHKNINKLRCHYCGITKSLPKVCPECKSSKIEIKGFGTQKLEETVKTLFPGKKIIRVDSDTVKKEEDYFEFYDKVKNNEADILIGTQMISKGLDFKNVSLVGIISVDMTINIPQYNSYEKSYELIRQVAGRSGRAIENSRVILQSYRPDDNIIKYAVSGDYEKYYNEEIKLRHSFEYPPYVNMINILISSEDENILIKEAKKMRAEIIADLKIKNMNAKISNLIKAPIEKIMNRYRYQVIIKSSQKDMKNLREILRERVYTKNSQNNKITYGIYINPKTFM